MSADICFLTGSSFGGTITLSVKPPAVPSMLYLRPSTIALAKSLIVLISYIPALHSRPTNRFSDGFEYHFIDGFVAEDPSSRAFWWKLVISVILVLIGGVLSGILEILKLSNSG